MIVTQPGQIPGCKHPTTHTVLRDGSVVRCNTCGAVGVPK